MESRGQKLDQSTTDDWFCECVTEQGGVGVAARGVLRNEQDNYFRLFSDGSALVRRIAMGGCATGRTGTEHVLRAVQYEE